MRTRHSARHLCRSTSFNTRACSHLPLILICIIFAASFSCTYEWIYVTRGTRTRYENCCTFHSSSLSHSFRSPCSEWLLALSVGAAIQEMTLVRPQPQHPLKFSHIHLLVVARDTFHYYFVCGAQGDILVRRKILFKMFPKHYFVWSHQFDFIFKIETHFFCSVAATHEFLCLPPAVCRGLLDIKLMRWHISQWLLGDKN